MKTFRKFEWRMLATGMLAALCTCVLISCGAPKKSNEAEIQIPESFKILMIGNSYSDDALGGDTGAAQPGHFTAILQNLGVKDYVVGNLFIGGCTLAMHAANAEANLNAYEYRKTSEEDPKYTRTNTPETSILTALQDEDWDIITLQQASILSGKADQYDGLQYMIDYVKENGPENAKLYWFLGQPWNGDDVNKSFTANYNADRMAMYNGMCSAVQTNIVPNGDFDGIIPVATVVMNVCSSYIDTNELYRDNGHMSFALGRYVSSMGLAGFVGLPVENVTYMPVGVPKDYLPVIKEAVANALKTPFAITQSSYTDRIRD